MKNKNISLEERTFHGREVPESGYLVGYGALIERFQLPMPIPNRLALINKKFKQYRNDQWIVLTPRHKPEETLYDQIVFAMKYEGINLLFFKKLFETISKREVIDLVQNEYSGLYARKIWFLFEWLMNEKLPIPDLTIKNFVPFKLMKRFNTPLQ